MSHKDGCQCVDCSKARWTKHLSELPPLIIPRVERSVAEVQTMYPPWRCGNCGGKQCDGEMCR